MPTDLIPFLTFTSKNYFLDMDTDSIEVKDKFHNTVCTFYRNTPRLAITSILETFGFKKESTND